MWPAPSITRRRRTPPGSDKFSVEISRGERPTYYGDSSRGRRRRRLYRAGVLRLTDGWASRSTVDGADPPGYTQAIRLSLDGSWSSLARRRRIVWRCVVVVAVLAGGTPAINCPPAVGPASRGRRELVVAGPEGWPTVRATISSTHAGGLIKATTEPAAVNAHLPWRRHNLCRQSATLADKLRWSASSMSQRSLVTILSFALNTNRFVCLYLCGILSTLVTLPVHLSIYSVQYQVSEDYTKLFTNTFRVIQLCATMSFHGC